jgi:hypothetical protein
MSIALSTTFTGTNTTRHSISLSEQNVYKDTVKIPVPQSLKSITIQIWQLNLKFTTDDQELIQDIGPDNGGLLFHSFNEPE